MEITLLFPNASSDFCCLLSREAWQMYGNLGFNIILASHNSQISLNAPNVSWLKFAAHWRSSHYAVYAHA